MVLLESHSAFQQDLSSEAFLSFAPEDILPRCR
ncbi:hypothetical protein M529_12425 [Sphingobium ummariense RL-3]|uniref:Uncharacterized protein n=1 Tax=Sphingobium ummariense RL-3 TaxID=1346791 RepID=T0KEQ0_9SPHN|nr:hypothetical protein M529_12425 [Sphingobium ummariense RL-3]